jgi:hypothetical protein
MPGFFHGFDVFIVFRMMYCIHLSILFRDNGEF